MEAAASGLAARLAREGGSADDWKLLAQSYDFLGRADDARRARERAASAPGSKGPLAPPAATLSPTAAAIVANQMTSARQPAEPDASGTVADLERRLRSNPGDTQALLDLAGLQRRHHDYAQARDTFAKLVGLNAMTAPAWALARYATKYSGHAGRASATTSPGPTPRATNPAATSSLTRSRSAYVTDHPSAATYTGVSANRRAASPTTSRSTEVPLV